MWKSSFFLLLILLSFSIEIEFSKLRHLIELMEVGGGGRFFFQVSFSSTTTTTTTTTENNKKT